MIPAGKQYSIRFAENEGENTNNRVLNLKASGSSGTDLIGGLLSEDYLNELTGTQKADAFDKMRRGDAKIKMCLGAVLNPIKSADWSIENGLDDEAGDRHRRLVEKCLFETLDKRWKSKLHEILSMCTFGYSLFERVHKVFMNDPEIGTYIGYRSLAWRSPRTIEDWKVNLETGELESVWQLAVGDGQKNAHIPAKYLTRFTLEQEGQNFEGVSLLRAAYGPWLRKQTYLKLEAIGMEKYAIPTPVLEVPAGKENSSQVTDAVAVMEAYTSHQSQYITKPAGWNMDFMKVDFDPSRIRASIKEENVEIVNAFLANFLELGQSGSGSYALSNDLSDFFLGGIVHIADIITEEFNECIIPELVDLNFGPQKEYPYLKHSGIQDRAGKEFAEIIKILTDSGAVNADDKLETHLRTRFNLPEAETTTVRSKDQPNMSLNMKVGK